MFRRSCKIALTLVAVLFIVRSAGAAELVIGSLAEPSIDPHYLYVATNIAYSNHIFGRLVNYDENIRTYPGLAVSWKTLDDTTWEFKLRKNVKFHDGSDFTAKDVVFSFNRIPNVPDNPGSYISTISGIASTKIVDPHILIIKTHKPVPTLPIELRAVAIVSEKVCKGAATADFTSGRAAIGTGPYKFVEYVPGKRLVLKRNEDYWDKKPAYERVTFRIFSNNEARMAALMGGVVDMIDFVPPGDVERLKSRNFNIFKRPSDRIIFLVCDNTRDKSPYVTDKNGKPLDKNPLRDIRVREAISKAIFRKAVTQQVMGGLAFPASQLIPESWFSFNPDISVEKFDPAGARKLLAEAGYAEGFGLTIHGPNDRYVNDAKICEAVAQMLTRIGLKMKVETMPKSEYFGRMISPENEFSLYLMGWGNSASGDSSACLLTTVHTYDKAREMGSYNGGYSNPELDRIIEEAALIVDEAAREKMLQKAMAVAINDYGTIPLHAQSVIVATKEGIRYVPRADEDTLAMNARPGK